jgi:hypothetical protein
MQKDLNSPKGALQYLIIPSPWVSKGAVASRPFFYVPGCLAVQSMHTNNSAAKSEKTDTPAGAFASHDMNTKILNDISQMN